MALREEFEQFGNFAFRWRSYIPLILAIFYLVVLLTVPSLEINQNRRWELLCCLIAFAGLALRVYAVGFVSQGSSGRNVLEQRAHALNTSGVYSLIRHPLYLSNFIIWVGVAMFTAYPWIIFVSIAFFWSYYEKIMFAEEEFLRREYGEVYLRWANITPAFMPYNLFLWRKPQAPFSWKNAVRREYSGFFAIVSVFSVIKLIKDSVAAERIVVNGLWFFIFIASFLVYLCVMYLKKRTNFLDVEVVSR